MRGKNYPFKPGRLLSSSLLPGDRAVAEAKRSQAMTDRVAPAGYDPTRDPHLHLLVDNHDIQDQWGLERIIQQPRQGREQPLVVADQPWEGTAVLAWGSVLYVPEERQWKLWYEGYNRNWADADRYSFCHALSADGTRWEKPNFGLVEFRGSSANNIVYHLRDFAAAHGGYGLLDITGVIYDPADEESRRYKTIFQQNNPDHTVWGEYAAFSPDGIHWQRRAAAVLPAQGDRTNIYHDWRTGRYVLTTRAHNNMPDNKAGLRRKRVIAWSESDDFIHWSRLRTIIKPDDYDPPDTTQFYGMVPFRYGARYLGFLEVYHTGSEHLDVQLAVSVDGIHWERVGSREPFLPVGPVGSWDSIWVSFACNQPHVVGDQLWLYYHGRSTGHRVAPAYGAIGRTVIGRDRFVALAAGHDEGQLVTEPVEVGGEQLLVNAACIGGELAVEVIGDDGRALPGYERRSCQLLAADSIDWRVTWAEREDLRVLVGQQVRLRFWLRNGRLFAYRFAAAG